MSARVRGGEPPGICIPIPFRPTGGGHYFLRSFRAFLDGAGWRVTGDLRDRYAVLFTNHWMVPARDILRAVRRNPDVRIVQRIDGAARDYGRAGDADRLQAEVDQLADLTIFQSRYARFATREKFRVIERDGPVIHNPVDVRVFRPEGERLALPGRVRVACSTWSTNPAKGAPEVYALARAHRAIDFVLCGNYPDAPRLPNVHRLGVLDREPLARALRSCHLLLTFSRNEACPNHVLEALACGLPVLYRDSGAMAEVVGECGLALEPAEFEARLAALEPRREELSRRARARALAEFHPQRIFPRYLEEIRACRARPTAKASAARRRRAWLEPAQRSLGLVRRPSRVYLAGSPNWSVAEDTRYLAQHLARELGVDVRATREVWRRRHAILHFLDRYGYLLGDFERIHPSNAVFLTWYHGSPRDTSDINIVRGCEALPRAAPHLRGIVVPCRASRDALLGLGVPAAKVTLIPLGVDLARFRPAAAGERRAVRERLGIADDALCVGSFQKDGHGFDEGLLPKWIKGPDVLVEVLARVAARQPKLVVLLTGPARGFVKAGLEKAGVRHVHVELPDPAQVAACFRALDLYLVTSRTEGGPKGLLEGWASGVPVVSTRMGMPADLIRDGETGRLADCEDVPALALAVEALLDDPELQRRCRDRALFEIGRYSWSRVARDHYERLYAPLLGAPRAPRP